MGKMFAEIFICLNLHLPITGKISKIRTYKNFKQHSVCFTFDFDPEAKTIILSCTFSPLCQLFGFFRKRISHVLQLLVEFVHFIFAYATFSRFPSGAFQGLLRQKRGTLFECHCIQWSFYLTVLLFYKVICATRQSSCLQYQGKGRTFISQLIEDPE